MFTSQEDIKISKPNVSSKVIPVVTPTSHSYALFWKTEFTAQHHLPKRYFVLVKDFAPFRKVSDNELPHSSAKNKTIRLSERVVSFTNKHGFLSKITYLKMEYCTFLVIFLEKATSFSHGYNCRSKTFVKFLMQSTHT